MSREKLFEYVVTRNYKEILTLKKSGISLDEVDEHGCTPLRCSASRGDEAMVRFLLVNGANPNIADEEAVTPLIEVISGGSQYFSEETIKLFIAKGANLNTQHDESGTPLICAVRQKRKSVVELLLRNGADPNFSAKGLCFFHNRLYNESHIDREQDGKTALHVAVMNNDAEMVDLLIAAKAYLDLQMNRYGGSCYQTPMDIAKENKNRKIIEKLQAAEAVLPSKRSLKPDPIEEQFLDACANNDFKTVNSLLDHICAHFYVAGLEAAVYNNHAHLLPGLLNTKQFFLLKKSFPNLLRIAVRNDSSLVLENLLSQCHQEKDFNAAFLDAVHYRKIDSIHLIIMKMRTLLPQKPEILGSAIQDAYGDHSGNSDEIITLLESFKTEIESGVQKVTQKAESINFASCFQFAKKDAITSPTFPLDSAVFDSCNQLLKNTR